jgi:hypothetical protein
VFIPPLYFQSNLIIVGKARRVPSGVNVIKIPWYFTAVVYCILFQGLRYCGNLLPFQGKFNVIKYYGNLI